MPAWNFLDLEIILAVERHGSFIDAANQLDISPAYVSKRLNAFEKSLGVTLFLRTTRQVQITPEGRSALYWAQQLLDGAESLKQAVQSAQQGLKGSLRVATSLRLGRNHVAPILDALGQAHPELDIWLELVDRRIDLIKDNFDVDIRAGDVTEAHLISHKVCTAQRFLCAAPSYLAAHGTPQDLASLSEHSCLVFRDRGQAAKGWRLTGPEGTVTVKPHDHYGSNHSDVARHWAETGRGIILLSDWDVQSSLEQGSLQRVLPVYAQRADVWAVTRARLDTSVKLKTCVEYLIDALRSGPYALKTSSP